MSRPVPLRPEDPRQLGRYRLINRLGAGGQGVVFLAESPERPRVAVKLLHARLLDDERVRRRLVGEVEAVRRVAPFCTAQVLDADLDGDRPYIVSELVDGVSLQEHIAAEGPRVDGSLDRIAVGTATALAAIHRAGVVHRDFKPGNVLLGMDGPRVIDFGISRMMDATITTGKIPFGTPAYMSPEQIKGESAGPPADMFSWALTVAYAATGRHAFSAGSYHEVLARILYGRPDLGPLDGPLREIVVSCLAVEPGDRPVAEEVLRRLYGSTAASRPDGPPGAGPVSASGFPTAELPVTEDPVSGFPTAELPVTEDPASGFSTGELPVTGDPIVEPRAPEGSTAELPAVRTPRGRRRWLLIAAAGVAITAAVAGAAAAWLRDDFSYKGTWVGVADHATAERVFPVEVRFAEEAVSMRWGADLHCTARLSPTGAGAAYRLEQVRGRQCYPGTVVFSRDGADRLVFQVTRSGEAEARYSGAVTRSS
ncbi:serine/threonine-protein kinase [Streptosporangium roseum]|uniref:Serine/threonine protein kinase-like protein n=1 Tax=Streptosporangium roseum (strain ATCC 12428 / DSM 43021 / JCM 3005 / KCTC 9067 / NCIMB 10171 / NRRL 2505 / NI 9100) TaxID=479432 RepID=D2AW09_STRRD|nr:serine/threonine-protein kinase [Streptosporangium roseum]ACZ84962.1 Serine/threonine protein kinase-like protein [Streptosporangium roseum DSM 43021]